MSTVADLLLHACDFEAQGNAVQGLRCREEALVLISRDIDATSQFEDFMKRANMLALSMMSADHFEDSFTILSTCDALSRREAANIEESVRVNLRATTLNNMGLFYQMREEPRAALASLQAAVDLIDDATTQLSISNVFYSMGDAVRAVFHSGRAIDMAEVESASSLDGKPMTVLERALHSHGMQQESLKDYRAAAAAFMRAYYIVRSEGGEGSTKAMTARAHLTRCVDKAKRAGITLPATPANVLRPSQPRSAGAQRPRPPSRTLKAATPRPSAHHPKPKRDPYGPPTRPSTAAKVPHPPADPSSADSHYAIPVWVFRGMSDAGRKAYDHFASQPTPHTASYPPIEAMPASVRYPVAAATLMEADVVLEFKDSASDLTRIRPRTSLQNEGLDLSGKRFHTEHKSRRQRAHEALAHLLQSFLRQMLSRQVLDRAIRFEIQKQREWEEAIQKAREAEQVRLRLEFDMESALRTAPLHAELEALRRANETKVEENADLSRKLITLDDAVHGLQERQIGRDEMVQKAEGVMERLATLTRSVTDWKGTSDNAAQQRLAALIVQRDTARLIQRNFRKWSARRYCMRAHKKLEQEKTESSLAKFQRQKKLRVQQLIQRVLLALLHKVRARIQWRKARDYGQKIGILQQVMRQVLSARYVHLRNTDGLVGDLVTIQRVGKAHLRRVLFYHESVLFHRALVIRETLSSMNIQKIWRSFKVKKRFSNMMAEKMLRLSERKHEYASRRLGAWWRGHCVFKTVHAVFVQHRRETAAREAEDKRTALLNATVMRSTLLIQRIFKSYLAWRVHTHATQVRLRAAVVYLEAQGRCYAAKLLCRLQRVVKAIAEVRVRRRTAREVLELRQWYAHREEEEEKATRRLLVVISKVTRIQAQWRGFKGRRDLAKSKALQVEAWDRHVGRQYIVIQAFWRGVRGRRSFNARRAMTREATAFIEEGAAARFLVGTVRRVCTGHVERASLGLCAARLHCRSGLETTQRETVLQQEVNELASLVTYIEEMKEEMKRRVTSMSSEVFWVVQNEHRNTTIREEAECFFSIEIAKSHSVNELLRYVHSVLHRERQRSVAGNLLQYAGRGCTVRRQLAKERHDMKTVPVTKLQCVLRAQVSSMLRCVRWTKNTAATNIQRVVRGCVSRKKIRIDPGVVSFAAFTIFDRFVGAAEDIQRVWRGHAVRSGRRPSHRRASVHSIYKKQSLSAHWTPTRTGRIHITMPFISTPPQSPKAKRMFGDWVEVAQRAWRCFAARQRRASRARLVEISLSAMPTLHRMCRGLVARKALGRRHRAVLTLHGAWRMWAVMALLRKKSFQCVERNGQRDAEEIARWYCHRIVNESMFRMALTPRRVPLLLSHNGSIESCAATIIQSAWRAFTCRVSFRMRNMSRVEKQRHQYHDEAAVMIQKSVRRKLSESPTPKM